MGFEMMDRDAMIEQLNNKNLLSNEKKRLIQKLYQIAKEKNDPTAYAYYYHCMVLKWETEGNMEQMLRNILLKLQYCELMVPIDLKMIRDCYNYMGVIYSIQGHFLQAIDCYWKQLDNLEEDEESYGKNSVSISINVGILYNMLKDYDKAISYFMAAKKLYHKYYKNGVDRSIIIIYVNLLDSYYYLGKYQQADSCMRKIKKLMVQCKEDSLEQFTIQVKYFILDIKLGRPEEAKKRISDLMKFEYSLDFVEELLQLAEVFLEEGEFSCFLETIERLEQYAEQQKISSISSQALTFRLRYLEKTGDYDQYRRECALYFKNSKSMEKEELEAKIKSLETYSLIWSKDEKNLENEKVHELLRRRCEQDELTQIPNRYRVKEYCGDAFQKAVQEELYLSIAIIDIDFFKQFNDNYGHLEGDSCLIHVADVIKKSIGKEDLCARYGGDEFLIVFFDKTAAEVNYLAEQIRQQVMSLSIPHEFSKAASVVTISQGIANAVPKEGQTLQDYLIVADMALYKVKKRGRNAVELCAEVDFIAEEV